MSKLIKLIKNNAPIEQIEANLIANINNKNYINIQYNKMWTALMWAVFKDNIEAVKLLLKHNADINIKTNFFNIALNFATNKKIINLLKKPIINNVKNINNNFAKTKHSYGLNFGFCTHVTSTGLFIISDCIKNNYKIMNETTKHKIFLLQQLNLQL